MNSKSKALLPNTFPLLTLQFQFWESFKMLFLEQLLFTNNEKLLLSCDGRQMEHYDIFQTDTVPIGSTIKLQNWNSLTRKLRNLTKNVNFTGMII